MRLLIPLVAGLALVGCKPAADTGDTAPEETQIIDTDTGVVYEYGFQGYTQLPEGAERPGSVKVGLVFLVKVQEDGQLDPGATLASTEISGSGVFRVDLLPEGPPQTQKWPPDPLTWPLLQTATYFPMAFDDEDEDGAYTEGEPIVGLSLDRWLMWVEGPGPEGWPQGWTVIDPNLDQADADPSFLGISAESEVVLRGLENTSLTIAGTWEAPTPHATLGLAGIDYHWVSEGEGDDRTVFDESLADGSFDVDADRRPSATHFFEHPALGLRYALEAPLVYDDDDGSGAWSPEEGWTGATACYEGQPVLLRYLEPPVFMGQAQALETRGWSAGYRLFTGYDGVDLGTELTVAQAQSLVLDTDCTLPTKGDAP